MVKNKLYFPEIFVSEKYFTVKGMKIHKNKNLEENFIKN